MKVLVFNEQMVTLFALEIGVGSLILIAGGVLAMHLRAHRLNHRITARHYLITGISAVFLACILAFTLTPISIDGKLCNPSLYYPRLYAGWSWGQAFEQTRGLGLRRFTTGVFAQLFFNIAMFIPLGVLTAGYLRWGVRASALAGFGLSLFIELSQLSGNWGMAPCPYRTFDVDDLINNTAGAVIGALLVLLVRWMRRGKNAANNARSNP